tara:strand:- start:262 stop:582 length:321 start_codon:yes stop_codon:yes gene_type:complete
MKFIKLLILLSGLSIILNSCSSLSDAGKVLRNEKLRTTDEFLIEKKDPLTQPPDFKNIPEPGSIGSKTEPEQNSIKKILRSSKSQSTSNQNKSSSTEEFILNQIKK